MIGQTISHYRILEQLDSGGMGEVYRAEDLRHGRQVALKFLSPELTRNPPARARFEREARAISALEHPNVCTVHDVGETDDGRAFLAMPFYRGETLKERVARGPLPIAETLDLAAQIAAGLIKAHEKGLIHRDVKPGNVFVTDEGQVRILDFGLAKEVGDVTVTQSGVTFGSPAYVSPEQVLSQPLDARTDQWSLAVVVYEMLRGTRPFHAHSRLAILYNIVHREPEPLSSRRHDVSPAVDAVLARALAKDPEDRYSCVEEFLQELRRAVALGPAPRMSAWRRAALIGGLLAALLAIALAVRVAMAPDATAAIRVARTRPLTRAPGMERNPAFSSDGTRIAYVSDEPGVASLFVRKLADGSTAEGEERLLNAGIFTWDDKPVFSPGGEWIAFASYRQGGGVYLMAAAGGEPLRVAGFGFTPMGDVLSRAPSLAFSPDGRWLAIAGTLARRGLYLADVRSLIDERGIARDRDPAWELEQIEIPDDGASVAVLDPAFSPDGRRLAYVLISGSGVSVSTLWTVALDGSDPVAMTTGQYLDHGPVFSPDGRRLFFISDRGGSHDVWTLPLDRRGRPAAPPVPLTTGVGIGSFAMSPDGRRLVYSKVEDHSNLYRIPADSVAVRLEDAVPLTTGNQLIEFVDVSHDGRWLAFDSNRAGNMDLYLMPREGGEPRRLTSSPAHDWCPRFSPDGQEIVFHSLRSGNRDLWIWTLESGQARQLTDHPAKDWLPNFSPDGQEIVFESTRSGNVDLWIVPRQGGEPRQLTSTPFPERFPVYSPDGRWVAFESVTANGVSLFRIPAVGGEPERLASAWRIAPFAWSEDGGSIFALGRQATGYQANLWRVSVPGGELEALTAFRELERQVFQSLASDGEYLYFPLRERRGDLWLAELE